MLIKEWLWYLHEYKRKEVDIVFKDDFKFSQGRCLEIGAGDGFEATLLKDHFKFLVSTEYDKNSFKERESNIHYCICDAERLPFVNNSFDFIFSSSVIEHIRNKNLCLVEIKRVLKNNGLAIHIVPSRIWKLLNSILYYPYLFLLLFNKHELKRHTEEKKNRYVDYLFPRVHGQYKNHIDEFVNYGRRRWQELLENNGFHITNIIKLPLTSGYGFFNSNKIKKILEKIGFSSCYAFFMVEVD